MLFKQTHFPLQGPKGPDWTAIISILMIIGTSLLIYNLKSPPLIKETKPEDDEEKNDSIQSYFKS